MVVTMVWIESWEAVITSVCVLSAIGVILTCCICWQRKKKGDHHFYILDENGLTKVTTSEGTILKPNEAEKNQRARNMFRHLPSSDDFATSLSSKILSTSEKKKPNSENNLIQSMEIADAFDSAILRFRENDIHLPLESASNDQDKDDDVKSCISDDSKYTFYSTNPMARTVSAADTMRSSTSQIDLNNYVY